MKTGNNNIHRYFGNLLTVLAGMILISVTSCEQLVIVSESAGDDFVKIYMNEPDSNIYAIDIKLTSDGSYLVFGVVGDFMESKFDGNGSLYIMKTNSEGLIQWDTIFPIGNKNSFPSNIIETGPDEYAMIWNDGFGNHRLIQVNASIVSISKTDLYMPEHTGYIQYLIPAINPSAGFVMAAFGSQDIEGVTYNQFVVLKANADFSDADIFCSYAYSPEEISGYINDEVTFMKMIDNHLYLGHNEETYFFYGPVGNQMALMHVGDFQPIYEDRHYWISEIENPGTGTINCLLDYRAISGDESFYVRDMDLYPVQKTMDDLVTESLPEQMYILNPEKKVFIMDEFIVGSLLSQKIIVHTGIHTEELGSKYPYEACGIAKDPEGRLLIVGTTKLQYQDQRIFLIRYEP